MATIFISHSSLNNRQAIAVRNWLIEEGWNDIFLDLDPERGLKAGERWQAALKRASSTCELVIFLISPDWAASKWCLAEFLLAKQMNKSTVAAIVEETPFDDIPTELSAEWQIVDLTTGSKRRELNAAIEDDAQPVTVSFGEIGLQRLKIGLLHSGLDPRFFPWPPEHDPDRSPYRGLRALEEEDAGIFFGREGPIVDGLDILRGLRNVAPPRMLVILGASGAGKSSYMRAGLLPRLHRDSQHYRVLPVVRPDTNVIEGDNGLVDALGSALKEANDPQSRADIRAAIEAGASAVAKLLSPVARVEDEAPVKPVLVLPLDQGEELFLTEGEAEATTFLNLLRELLDLDDPSFAVLVTIRSDSYEPLQVCDALEGVTQKTYSLPPMPRGAHGEVILGPARRLSEASRPFEVEPALMEALLTDLDDNDTKDALPLLAFVLERLFREYGESGELTRAGYEATGRIRGAINAAVTAALQAADRDPDVPRDKSERMRILRSAMIPALATVDLDTLTPRRRVARLEDIPKNARRLLGHLVDQRLLSTDISQETGERTIEPAHESLLRQWDTLSDWLVEETEDLTMAERVRRAAKDWYENDHDPAWLVHSGGRLQLADRVAAREDFASLFGAEAKAYLLACREAEQARQAAAEAVRLREIAAQKQRFRIISGAFIVSLVLMALTGWQWREAVTAEKVAEDEARRARHAAAGGLAALSTIETERREFTKATKLALAAWPRKPGTDNPKLPDVLNNLSQTIPALIDGVEYRSKKNRATGSRRRIEISGNGKVAAFQNGNRLILRETASGQGIPAFNGPMNPYGEGFEFSANGEWLAIAPQNSSPVLISTRNPEEAHRIKTKSPASGFWFSRDGARLAIAEIRGMITLFDVQTLKPIQRFDLGARLRRQIWDVAVSPSQSHFAISTTRSLLVFEMSNPSHLVWSRRAPRGSLHWVDDDQLLLDARDDQLYLVDWKTTRVSELTSLLHATLPDHAALATWSKDGIVNIIDNRADPETVFPSEIDIGDLGQIRSLNFAADEKGLFAGDANGALWYWSFAEGRMVARFDGRHSNVAEAAIDADRSTVMAFEDGSIRTHPVQDASVRGIGKPFLEPADWLLSADGSCVVGWMEDGTLEVRETSDVSTVVKAINRAKPRFESFALSPDASMAAFSTIEGITALPLDEANMEWTKPVPDLDGLVPMLAFSPDGKVLGGFAADRYNSISFLMDPETGEFWWVEVGDNRKPSGTVQFSTDGRHVRFARSDWHRIDTLLGNDSEAEILADVQESFEIKWSEYKLSADRSRAVRVGAENKSIVFWDTATAVRLLEIRGLGEAIADFAFLPDGQSLISLNTDGSLSIWRLPNEIKQGNAFQIACEVLPDVNLEDATAGYPIEIDEPICDPSIDVPIP